MRATAMHWRLRLFRMRLATACAGVALISILWVSHSQPPGDAARPQPPLDTEDFRVSVSVDLVLLHATVRNRSGRYVTHLTRESFEVYEDGIRQSIRVFTNEDIPVTVGLVVDHSGSMHRKLADVSAAARSFAQASKPEDQIFVVNFNEQVGLGLPKSRPFTSNLDELEAAILNAPAAGETALYDAISLALQHLQLGVHRKKALLIISDGGDNASRLPLSEVVKKVTESGSLLYTMGIFDAENADKNPRVLRRLARASGGESHFPEKSGDAVATCQRIAHDIRNQYTIGYVSSQPSDQKAYRRIQVKASAPGTGQLNVRTRTGYFASR